MRTDSAQAFKETTKRELCPAMGLQAKNSAFSCGATLRRPQISEKHRLSYVTEGPSDSLDVNLPPEKR